MSETRSSSGSPGPSHAERKPSRSAYLRALAGVVLGEMRRQGVTRRALAERSGLSVSQVSRLLSGRHSMPVEHLRAITDALLLCPCQVFHGIDDRRGHVHIAAQRRAMYDRGLRES